MSVYNVPFTSSLQMWSPSPSINYNFNITTATEVPFTATEAVPTVRPRFFHHEPVFYPSACMICGLLHHPVPHTVMQQQHPTSSPPVMITPAPLEPTLPPSIPKSGKMKRRKRTRSHNTIFTIQFKTMSRKFTRFFALFLKAPLLFRRHNIYPVKRDRLD